MIYFIKYGEDRVKIGYTGRSAKKRMYELQREAPSIKLELLLEMAGNRKDEKNIHDMFRDVCVGNEYFKLTDRINSFIYTTKEGTASYMGITFMSERDKKYAKNIFQAGKIDWYFHPWSCNFKHIPQFYLKELDLYFLSTDVKDLKQFANMMYFEEYKKSEKGRTLVIGNGKEHIIIVSGEEGCYTDNAILCMCQQCGKLYFREEDMSWECSICGRTGDSYIDVFTDKYYNDIDFDIDKNIKEYLETS